MRFAGSVRFTAIDTVLALSRAAEFVPVLGDSQRLMLGSYPTGTYGPRVQVSPYQYAYAHEVADLNQPTLLARLVNFDALPYPKLNLAAFDTVYVWTEQMSSVLPREGRVLLVSTLTGQRVEARLSLHRGPGFRASQAAARFLWDDADERTCILCTWTEWCVIQ